MRITGGQPNVPATVVAGPSLRSGGAAFSVGRGSSRASAGAGSAAPLATLDAILALQGEDDGRERRRKSARRGQDLLAALDGLKAALLAGQVSPAALRRLADGVWSGAGPSGDPDLDEIVGSIELRAKVELAKLGFA